MHRGALQTDFVPKSTIFLRRYVCYVAKYDGY